MNLKKVIASVVTAATIFCGVGIVASAQWYTEKNVILPYTGWYHTGTKAASGPVQYTKVSYAGGNKSICQKITDKNGHILTDKYQGKAIGVTYRHQTDVHKGTSIRAAFATDWAAWVNVEATIHWQP